MRPFQPVIMSTSPSFISCACCAPDAHHTAMCGFSSLIFLIARSMPPGCDSTSYTLSAGTPSAISAGSSAPATPFRYERLPGNFFTSQKSDQLCGPLSPYVFVFHASTVENTSPPTQYSPASPGRNDDESITL